MIKQLLLFLSFVLTLSYSHKVTGQWDYLLSIPEYYYNNIGLTELQNGYVASIGWRGIPPYGYFAEDYYLSVVDTGGQEVFTKIFAEELFILKVLPADSGMYVVGFQEIDSLDNREVYVSKIDYDNQIVWESTYGHFDLGKPIEALVFPDQKIGLFFTEKNPIDDGVDSICFKQLSPDGTTLSVVTVEASGEFDAYRSIALAEDGNLLVTGDLNDSLYLQKIDLEGSEIWKKVFFDSWGFKGRKVTTTQDGKIIVMGWILNGSGLGGGALHKTALLKTDSEGDLLWQHQYLAGASTSAYDFCETDDGGFVMIGDFDNDDFGGEGIFKLKTNSEGEEEWKKRTEDLEQLEQFNEGVSFLDARNIIQTKDGNLVMATNVRVVNPPIVGKSLYLLKTAIDCGGTIGTADLKNPPIVSNITLSPIPASSLLTIEVVLTTKTRLSIEIINSAGQITNTIRTNERLAKGIHHFKTDVSGMQSGYYQLRVCTPTESQIKSFIKTD